MTQTLEEQRAWLDHLRSLDIPVGNPVQRNYVRVLVGDRVRVALMPADKTRGRIVGKL